MPTRLTIQWTPPDRKGRNEMFVVMAEESDCLDPNRLVDAATRALDRCVPSEDPDELPTLRPAEPDDTSP